MEIHTLLRSEVEAFDFLPEDFEPIRARLPRARLVHYDDEAAALKHGARANYLLTWTMEPEWYAAFDALEAVFTPAAGADWVKPDPDGNVTVHHGTFHGRLLRESLLHAMLFMNHNMPAMLRNFEARGWDRNLQADCRLLAGQVALIIGYGNIGRACGELLASLGMSVIGVRREAQPVARGEPRVVAARDLSEWLPQADHVVALLPGDESTEALLNEERLARCKAGAFIYNFGRGNALPTSALLAHLDRLGGAFLDVVDEEPLPPASKLWVHPKVMITPHSSCVYRNYKPAFLEEAAARILGLTT